MAPDIDFADYTDSDLSTLITRATAEQQARKLAADRERTTDEDGVRGQDVNDPGHGAITTPTPHAVREEAPGGLQPGARVEGTTVRDADEVGSAERIEEAARRVV